MPSPVGHALAGAAVALTAERFPSVLIRTRTLVLVCVGLAVAPDLDLVYQPIHRAFTHSFGAAILVMIIVIAVTGKVTRRGALAIGLVCAAAWSSHLVLDWLGTDPYPPRGIKALWPFSNRWFISDWNIFLGTERRQLFTVDALRQNVRAITREVLLLTPIVVLMILTRRPKRPAQRDIEEGNGSGAGKTGVSRAHGSIGS